ncbi:alpha-hydroxy-acid oxidizing protein [Streptomyces puniciscabiei]
MESGQRDAEGAVLCTGASNHGGRQLDGSVTALDALPEVVSAVARHVPATTPVTNATTDLVLGPRPRPSPTSVSGSAR